MLLGWAYRLLTGFDMRSNASATLRILTSSCENSVIGSRIRTTGVGFLVYGLADKPGLANSSFASNPRVCLGKGVNRYPPLLHESQFGPGPKIDVEPCTQNIKHPYRQPVSLCHIVTLITALVMNTIIESPRSSNSILHP